MASLSSSGDVPSDDGEIVGIESIEDLISDMSCIHIDGAQVTAVLAGHVTESKSVLTACDYPNNVDTLEDALGGSSVDSDEGFEDALGGNSDEENDEDDGVVAAVTAATPVTATSTSTGSGASAAGDAGGTFPGGASCNGGVSAGGSCAIGEGGDASDGSGGGARGASGDTHAARVQPRTAGSRSTDTLQGLVPVTPVRTTRSTRSTPGSPLVDPSPAGVEEISSDIKASRGSTPGPIEPRDAITKTLTFDNAGTGVGFVMPAAATDGSPQKVSFSKTPLYDGDAPSSAEVHQGKLGNCYFVASVMAVAHHSPERIVEAIK